MKLNLYLNHHVRGDSPLARILATARVWQSFTRYIETVLPHHLHGKFLVYALEHGCVYLSADDGTVATRLTQYQGVWLPALKEHVKRVWKEDAITTFTVTINPNPGSREKREPRDDEFRHTMRKIAESFEPSSALAKKFYAMSHIDAPQQNTPQNQVK